MDVSIIENMMKLYYEHPKCDDLDEDTDEEGYGGRETIEMTWDKEEGDLDIMMERIKSFLRAIGYAQGAVDRIQMLTNDQMAKLHLLGEDIK